MSQLASRAQKGLGLSAVRRLPRSPCVARSGYVAAQRYLSSDKTPSSSGPSFKGQMMESISARMAREQAERARAARMRDQSSTSRNFSITFSRSLPTPLTSL